MQKIFISYSRKDINFVRKLAGDLEKAGYDVWWDLTDLRGGDDWPRAIPAAIEASQSFLIVLSPNSAVSDWVEKEYTHALSLRKKIIPVMLQRSSVPFALNTINYVDFTSEDYAANFNNLLTALGHTGERPVVEPFSTAALPAMLRKYAVLISIGAVILLGMLAALLFSPIPPPETPTPSISPTTAVMTS
ncbi:MAG TPA: toll/interleukin-1 receptor domain-containing protein, partial [Anaerolineales bacterium]|nr:toll/interleukin-1 receptor domain-containing protein [Anaerolineales bacterium]